MDPGLLPVFCCQCHKSIDSHRLAAALPCDCLVALCLDCARRQLDDCSGYSYESLIYSCPICTEQATSLNGGFLKVDEEKVMQSVDILVSEAQFRLEGKWPRKAYREKVNLRGLLKKFAAMVDLNKEDLVSNLLKISLSEEELRISIARLEWLLQNLSYFDPPFNRLPWGPLDHVDITQNRWLPAILTDPESVESICMACCETIEPDNTVLYGCSCISYICCKCALIRCQDDSNTFHEGLKCVMCNNKSRHLLRNVEQAKILEADLFKAASVRLRTWKFAYALSDRHKQFAAKFVQAFQLYFVNDALPEGCRLPSESQYHAMSFLTLKLQLCRMEKAAQQKELHDYSDDPPTASNGQVELPLGPLKPLKPRCNPFLSFYLQHAPEIGINIGQQEQLFIMPVQAQSNLMRTKDDFIRREAERKLRLQAESKLPQQRVVEPSKPEFGEKYLATQSTHCPECSVDPRNLFLLHRHLYCHHERAEYAPKDCVEQIEEFEAIDDLRSYAAKAEEDDDEDEAVENEPPYDQVTLDGMESYNEDNDDESIEFVETVHTASSSSSRPSTAVSKVNADSVEEGEILDEVPTASTSSSSAAAAVQRHDAVSKPLFSAIALDEGKAAAERVQNLKRTQLSGVYELKIESADEHAVQNESHGFSDFRLRYEIHLNPEDMTRFWHIEGRDLNSSVDGLEENEVFQGVVQLHTDLCPMMQIRLGLKIQAGFTGMVNKYFFDNHAVHSAKTLGVLGVPRLSRLIIRPVETQAWEERPYHRANRHWIPPWLRKRQGHVTKAQHAVRFAEGLRRKRLEEERRNPKPVVLEQNVIVDLYEQSLMESCSDSDDDDCGKKKKKKRKQPQASSQSRPAPPPPPPPTRWQPPAPPRPPPLPPLPGHLSQRLGLSVQEEQVSWQEDRRRGGRDDHYDHDQHANKRRRYDQHDYRNDDRRGSTRDFRGDNYRNLDYYGQRR